LSVNGDVPFQYVVTTTSAPPAELQKPECLILELLPGSPETMLFKCDLVPVLSGLEGAK
jgi:hypothetical protein